MTKLANVTKLIVDQRDRLFMARIVQPLPTSSVRRQYVKHAPTNLTVAQVITAAEEAHPNCLVAAKLNCKKGITLTIRRKVGEQ